MFSPAHVLPVFLALLAGLAFGGVYFALLWQAAKTLTGEGPGWRFVLELGLRLGLVLAGLWLLIWTGGGAARILAAGLGFALARLVAARLARPSAKGD